MTLWLLLSGAVATFLAGDSWLRYRERKLARQRSGQGFEEFAIYFSGESIPRDKLREVYDYFQQWQSMKDFPVQPEDGLYEVYGIVDEDVDDAVIELAKKWGVSLPPDAEWASMGTVSTVADIVRLLSRRPSQ